MLFNCYTPALITTYKYRTDESFPIKRTQLTHSCTHARKYIYLRTRMSTSLPPSPFTGLSSVFSGWHPFVTTPLSPQKQQRNKQITFPGTHFCSEIYSAIHTHFPHGVSYASPVLVSTLPSFLPSPPPFALPPPLPPLPPVPLLLHLSSPPLHAKPPPRCRCTVPSSLVSVLSPFLLFHCANFPPELSLPNLLSLYIFSLLSLSLF